MSNIRLFFIFKTKVLFHTDHWTIIAQLRFKLGCLPGLPVARIVLKSHVAT